MRDLPRLAGDVVLGVAAVVVISGAAFAVTREPASSAPIQRVAVTGPTSAPSATPTPTPTSTVTSTVLLAGPDLVGLQGELAARTGYTVAVVSGTDGLAEVSATPTAVVLEILAGSKTTARTTQAITAVQDRWPGVLVVVIGPFSSADRLSAAAVKSAAVSLGATFLDPVDRHWRTADSSPTLTATDLTAVSEQLAAALA